VGQVDVTNYEQQMHEIFKSLDKNRDGRINFSELYSQALKHAHQLEIITKPILEEDMKTIKEQKKKEVVKEVKEDKKVPIKKPDEYKARTLPAEASKLEIIKVEEPKTIE
jgi:Ca2+-binding EF-hand superfamily protein